MAHSQLNSRRAKVRELLSQGIEITSSVARDLAREFGVSQFAVSLDVLLILWPKQRPTPFLTPQRREEIFCRDGRICQYCGRARRKGYAIEHVIPTAVGGVGRSYNLVVSCNSCNMLKRRSVWIPLNFEILREENAGWAENILFLAGGLSQSGQYHLQLCRNTPPTTTTLRERPGQFQASEYINRSRIRRGLEPSKAYIRRLAENT